MFNDIPCGGGKLLNLYVSLDSRYSYVILNYREGLSNPQEQIPVNL